MLIVSDFSLAWPLVDPRLGRRTVADIIDLVTLAIQVEVPDYHCEGTWIGDGRRDARLDLEAILPPPLVDHADDFGLALGWGDEAAAKRLQQAVLGARWAGDRGEGEDAVSRLLGMLSAMRHAHQLA